jgi:RNA polymerase primary sigma factor
MRNAKPIRAKRRSSTTLALRPTEFCAEKGSPSSTTTPSAPALSPDPERPRGEPSTALNLYMREVGEVPLLTPEQEIQLAARIKRGDEQARDHMIRANLRLVVKIARQYEGLGLPLLDLINEGNLGLMKAVQRFDPAKGGKLSTYGAWWIKQNMRRALANQSKTIRLPIYVVDQIYHLSRVSMKLAEIFGREPSDAELAAEMDLSIGRIAELRNAAMRPVSLADG